MPVANQISPKHNVFLWQQVNTLGSLSLGRDSMVGQKKQNIQKSLAPDCISILNKQINNHLF